MGNVLEENLCDIWNGPKYQALREIQLDGKRKNCLACSDCKAILNQVDDIDEYREEILARLRAE